LPLEAFNTSREAIGMFIQVIEGRVSDKAAMRAAFDRWMREVSPGSIGWLGFTGGVTDEGRFIGLARFEDEASARRNSDRPEQDQWWAETSKLFEGDVTFRDCPDTVVFGGGGSDDAGFVQVIQGRVRDVMRLRDVNDRMEAESAAWADYRPEVIGGVTALHGDGGYTTAVYFTSEAEAREGERKEPPAELKALMEEEQSNYEGEPTYYDLRDPWLLSPQ
jgi:hypothetical protein